jgi:hypothetical protein
MNALDSLAGVRASDAERDHVAQILQTAAADGRLSPEEAGERLAAASAARLRDELARLIADLPEGQRGGERQQPLLGEPRVGGAAPPPPLRLFFHIARFGIVAALLVTLWGFSGARFFWPIWPLAFLALGVLARARRARWVQWRGPWWLRTMR